MTCVWKFYQEFLINVAPLQYISSSHLLIIFLRDVTFYLKIVSLIIVTQI